MLVTGHCQKITVGYICAFGGALIDRTLRMEICTGKGDLIFNSKYVLQWKTMFM